MDLKLRAGKRPFASDRVPWRLFLVGIGVALFVAVLLLRLVMQAPLSDITTLVTTLSVTSLLSLFIGYFVVRRGGARFPSLNYTLIVTYIWSAVVVMVNVWFMLSRMYFSEHDLLLSGVLLLFAAIISTTFGVFVAANISDGFNELEQVALQISEGNLDERATVSGHDELARLATVFNKMASQLQTAQAEREELEKLRRDLIAWTSHDLRTPLTSIRAMIEALHDGLVDDPDTVRRYYQTIRADIISLNTLIDDLFELAQLDAGGLELQLSPHSLADMVSDALERFQALAKQRDIRLHGDVRNDLDSVQLNAPKIERVLNNLLGNALRHTPDGGEVRVSGWRTPTHAVVTIQDSGEGFNPNDLERVFEQFYRGEAARSRATGGAGLGLAIARGIVLGHGGEIWAENAPQSGALVGFKLPVSLL